MRYKKQHTIDFMAKNREEMKGRREKIEEKKNTKERKK